MSNMDQFSLFNELSSEITTHVKSVKESEPNNNIEEENTICEHNSISNHMSLKTCIDCGKEFDNELIFDKEWRYYGSADNKQSSDPSRCQVRKSDVKGIEKDIKNMGFNEKIVEDANNIYRDVTNGKIFRGNSRKSIIFACVFNAYKMNNTPRSCEELIKVFNLEKKIGLRGIKYIHLNLANDSKVREVRITPHHIIFEMMKKFETTKCQIEEIQQMYELVRNKSSIINRSRPSSVAAGVIYYYIVKSNKDVLLKNFAEVVGLSELTIKKIYKEVDTILNKET